MAQAGFQQRGILIEILLFRWRRRAHFCEKCLCKSPEGRELGRELRVLGYVLLWWSEEHQAHGWAHGSLIGCINNNIGSEKANSSAGICVSHRAHPRQPTAPETPLSKVPESKTLTCQKKFETGRNLSQIPSPQLNSHILPASASCAVNILLAHSLEQPTHNSRPSLLAPVPRGNVPGNSGKPIQAPNQATAAVSCPVKQRQVKFHVSRTGK